MAIKDFESLEFYLRLGFLSILGLCVEQLRFCLCFTAFLYFFVCYS